MPSCLPPPRGSGLGLNAVEVSPAGARYGRPVRLRKKARAEDLREVYRRNVEAVYAFFAYSVPRHAAEDLTSATFERVVRSWSRYDPRLAAERTWILAIARNLLTDHFRRQRHRNAVSTDEYPALLERHAAGAGAGEELIDAEALRMWLEPLPARAREVVALRYGADLDAREIASLLGLSEANVHQIVSRSLRKLRKRVEEKAVRDSA